MKRQMVTVGKEGSRGASILMSRGNAITERSRAAMAGSQSPNVLSSLPLPPLTNKEEIKQTAVQLPQGRPGSDIDQVDSNIFIGNHESAKSLDHLADNKITHIVNAAIEIPNYHSGRFNYINAGLYDNPKLGDEDLLRILEPIYRYISAIISKNPSAKILVHCHMGMSRSASIVIYYLMRHNNWSYEESLKYLINRRPIVKPNRWYQQQLLDIEKLLK
jgi:hypothetical protein